MRLNSKYFNKLLRVLILNARNVPTAAGFPAPGFFSRIIDILAGRRGFADVKSSGHNLSSEFAARYGVNARED
jgi:hypothetical protein